ncbi:MAG: ATP synthase F1 subunit epsilon [bacterium]
MTNLLTLDIVTQEKRLLTAQATQITLDTIEGEITILPHHVPLLTRLKEGLLRYTDEKGEEDIVAIFGGFLEVDQNGLVSILADSAVRAADIDLARVEQAKSEAEATLRDKTKEQEFALAEAALKKTWLELKAANSKPRHSQS